MTNQQIETPSYDTISFLGEDCILKFGKYSNGRLAIRLVIAGIQEDMATATVNMSALHLDPEYVLVKDWSENLGILHALTKAGYLDDTNVSVPAGFARANVCRITDKLRAYPGFPARIH